MLLSSDLGSITNYSKIIITSSYFPMLSNFFVLDLIAAMAFSQGFKEEENDQIITAKRRSESHNSFITRLTWIGALSITITNCAWIR